MSTMVPEESLSLPRPQISLLVLNPAAFPVHTHLYMVPVCLSRHSVLQFLLETEMKQPKLMMLVQTVQIFPLMYLITISGFRVGGDYIFF